MLCCTMHYQGEETSKITHFPWDFVTPQEDDQATAIGDMHKKFGKIARVVRKIYSRTDRQTHRRADYNTSPPLSPAK